MCANTYVGSAFRTTKIGTDPSDTLDFLIRKYVPALRRLEHNVQDVIVKLVNISYFPKKTQKPEWEFKLIIKYSFSQTRPTKQQLEAITKKDFHYIILLEPHRGLLSYQQIRTTTTHRWANCESPAYDKCHKYTPLIESGTNHTLHITPVHLSQLPSPRKQQQQHRRSTPLLHRGNQPRNCNRQIHNNERPDRRHS